MVAAPVRWTERVAAHLELCETAAPPWDAVLKSQQDRDLVDFDSDSEGSSLGQSAAYYRAVAARARKLWMEATTPRVKRYLAEIIARNENLAGEAAGSLAISAHQ